MKGKTSIGDGGVNTLMADSKGAHSNCSIEWVGITDTYPASAFPGYEWDHSKSAPSGSLFSILSVRTPRDFQSDSQ